MLERRASMTHVVEPEAEGSLPPVGEVGDDGVVGVHDERRVGRERLHRRTPALGEDLQLPVAVELVAKEVREGDHTGPRALDRLGERRLVDLEQAEVRAPGRHERRREARQEVRARVVPRQFVPTAQDARRHRRRGRLAVRR
jgi:hypothetical protein